MRRTGIGIPALALALAAATPAASGPDQSSAPASLLVRESGGAATARGDEARILAARISGLSEVQRRKARRGEAFFNSSFQPAPASSDLRDGLGPLFNSSNCRSCHNSLGRGRPPFEGDEMPVALVLQLSAPGADGGWGPDPVYGVNFNPFATPGVSPEGGVRITHHPVEGRYADGREWVLTAPSYELVNLGYGEPHPELAVSPRLAQPVIGMGLLNAVPEDLILSLTDPDDADADGISGRANLVAGPDGKVTLGRFGWKANQVSLRSQTTAALSSETGITSRERPKQNCTAVQADCLAGPHGGEPEIADVDLDAIVLFQQTLAVPPRQNLGDPEVVRGATLFHEARCDRCHVPAMTTGEVPGLPQLSNQQIYPFSDLLLHDMGPALADGRPDGMASGSEWRTPPLWGLGRAEEIAREAFYLHDGRARSIEEAILWHGGEAAYSQSAFTGMAAADRNSLLMFLKSL